jgi:hypothetical protein
MPNGIPRWALEDYSGAEQDFSLWVEQQFMLAYHSTAVAQAINSDTGEILDDELMMRTRAMAKFQTLERTMQFKELISRSQIWQLYEANEKGWFRLLPAEFDSIEELLASLVEAAGEGTGEYYDLTFLVKQILPLLRKSGVDPQVVLGLTKHTSKARAAVPFLRELIGLSSEGNEEQQAQVKATVIEVVEKINSDIPVRQFRNEMQELRGKSVEAPPPMFGRRYILNGKELYLFDVSETQGRAMEIALRGLVGEIMVSDVTTLLKDIQLILGGDNGTNRTHSGSGPVHRE